MTKKKKKKKKKKMRKELVYICKAVLFVLILKPQNTFLVLEKRLCLNALVIPLAYNLYKRFEMSLRRAVCDSLTLKSPLCYSVSRKHIKKLYDEIPTHVLAR